MLRNSISGRRWFLPAALCLIYLVQCAWFLRTQSLTYDEPVHIHEGLDVWRNHRFETWNDHPPLARLLCTLPLLADKWQINLRLLRLGFQATDIQPDPETMAWRARGVNVLMGLLLAWLLWATARRMFSRGAANLALALFVFSPPVIAHFSLATTDGVGTLLIFAAAAGVVHWREQPSLLRTAILGLVLGLLLLAKFYTPVMFLLALVFVLALRPEGVSGDPRRWNWGKVAIAFLIACLVTWAGYFFHVSRLTLRDGELTVTFPGREAIHKPVDSRLNLTLRVPAGEYLEGLRTVARRTGHGQPAFFLGEVSQRGGWRFYYPVVILLKWPALALALFACSALLMLRGTLPRPPNLLVMASFPALFLAFALLARFNIGDRHILPVYPFVLLCASGTWEVARRQRTMVGLVVLAVLLHAADGLRYAPDYLSYFNVFVSPANSYRLLTDSNLDWGQGLLALRRYEREHPTEEISLAYFGSVDPALYGVRARPLAEGERASGTVIVSATHLSGQFLEQADSYHWVLRYPRTAILNHTLHVFQVPDSAVPDASPLTERAP